MRGLRRRMLLLFGRLRRLRLQCENRKTGKEKSIEKKPEKVKIFFGFYRMGILAGKGPV